MTTWKRRSGDVGDTIIVQLGGVADLVTAVSAEAHVKFGDLPTVTLTALVTDTANRLVTVQCGGLGGWLPTAQRGCWRMEIEVTFGSGAVLTWPAHGFDTVDVGPTLA